MMPATNDSPRVQINRPCPDGTQPTFLISLALESKTFDTGFYFSEGTVRTTPADDLLVEAFFNQPTDPDYLPSFNPATSLPENQK